MPEQTSEQEQDKPQNEERANQVTVAGYTAVISAFFAVGGLTMQPTWPMAFGVAALAAMVAVVCYFILKK